MTLDTPKIPQLVVLKPEILLGIPEKRRYIPPFGVCLDDSGSLPPNLVSGEENLPMFLLPVSYALPLTYGVDVLHGALHGKHVLPYALDLTLLGAFCVALFSASLWNVRRKWIV